MNTLKQRLLTNWHLMRIVRMALGIWLMIAAFQTKEWATGLFSLFFLYQGVTDTGCCGSQGCYTTNSYSGKVPENEIAEIEYEEIK